MPINAQIPLGVQPMQIQMPDPNAGMNALARAMQIKSAMVAQDDHERTRAETNSLNDAYKGAYGADGTVDRNKLYSTLATNGLGSKIPGVQKQFSDADKAKFEVQEAAAKGYKLFQTTIGAQFNDPNVSKQSVMATVAGLVQSGSFDGATASKLVQSLPDDPQQLRGALRQIISAQMTPEQMMTVFAPKPEKIDNGQQISYRDNNPNSPTYGQATGGAPVQKVADPGAVLTDQRTRSEGALNRQQSLKLHNDTVANENLRAGVTADGKMDANAERTAQAIASGQLPAPTGMALLNPKNQRILGRVMEINPQYDSTTVDAKKKAARDFASGQQGNAMRSFAVAGDHLAQLDKLVDAMNNGDMQLVNKLSNAYSQQTGNPAVTNFEAAKEIVGKEVVKAIVAGGGGVEERRELSQLLANAKSAQQLKGVITQFSSLMAAQHDALLQQRRAAGLPDSTIPQYTGGHGGTPAAAAGGVPADIAEILKKHGGK